MPGPAGPGEAGQGQARRGIAFDQPLKKRLTGRPGPVYGTTWNRSTDTAIDAGNAVDQPEAPNERGNNMPDPEETRKEETPGAEKTKEKAPELSAEQQSYLDRKVTEGIKTAADRMRTELKAEKDAEVEQQKKEAEQALLVAEGKYQELAETQGQELIELKGVQALATLTAQTAEMLREKKLDHLLPAFTLDSSSVEGRAKIADELLTIITEATEVRVKAALKTGDPPPGGKVEDPSAGTGTLGEQLAAANAKGDVNAIVAITNAMADAQRAAMS